MGTEDDGGDGISVFEAPGTSPPGVGRTLDGMREPDGKAGTAGPVFCGGTTFVGAVFSGGAMTGDTG
jgi:hypothetical protein